MMLAVEQNARAFFLQCRISARSRIGGYSGGGSGNGSGRGGKTCSSASFAVPSQRRCRAAPRRAFSAAAARLQSQALDHKPYYITSPIFYVNAAPHVGHLYTLVLTDIFKRWQVLRGDSAAQLLTGTDEHGMKIQKAAEKAKTNVQLFCDQHADQFKALAHAANIDYDRFIRTTDADHKAAVEHAWRELNHRGYIYEKAHEGWYCVSDETFYPESQTALWLDPSTGGTKRVSVETGKDVEWTSETNYHFRLSSFKDRLLEHYAQNPDFIVPRQRMNYIVKEVEAGLADLSVSRPASRLQWGIRVPGDESQTIYVWLDALINYLSHTGYPLTDPTSKGSFWPPDLQVIGKDIIRFHTIYWPAFLMALGLPLPKKFLSHAHWTMNAQKMSKSAGNGVNPFFAMDRYGVDTIRFYMAHDGGIVDDAVYENAFIADRYNTILLGGFGNLLQRVCRSQHFNVRESVQFVANAPSSGEKFLPEGRAALTQELSELLGQVETHQDFLSNVAERANACIEEGNPRAAVQVIVEVIQKTNKFFHNSAVWKRQRTEDPSERYLAHNILYLSAESVRIAAILLQPVMPGKMKIALDWLRVDDSRRTFQDATLGADFTYGSPVFQVGPDGPGQALFPKLLSSF